MIKKLLFILKIILKVIFIFILLIKLPDTVLLIIVNTLKENNNISTDLSKESEFSKFKIMLPSLTPDFKLFPSSINEIFNAKQIYISDIRITPEYIRFLRPINETQEKIFPDGIYSTKETIVNKKLFAKRKDQYNYTEFCKLALNEKLINDKIINYNQNPDISVVLPSFNKENMLLKSIRSIQNQKFKNIEIIIVNDCSNDNSYKIFNYLLETDPRIRIFHHITNMGVFRTRLDGILYSRGKYIILFDAGDLYEDNYVLLDAYKIIKKYNLDSCKFLFRLIKSFEDLKNFTLPFHVGEYANIEYKPEAIKAYDVYIFIKCGNIWNRLVRANIYIKGILLLNELMLNVYKNFWDDIWFNELVNKVSDNYTIFERVGYVYYYDGKGEGTLIYETMEQKSKIIKEYVSFLYFDYNFCVDRKCKAIIIRNLKYYNEENSEAQLKNFRSHFGVLNDLLKALINDKDINKEDRKYCKKLLHESKIREKEVNKYMT